AGPAVAQRVGEFLRAAAARGDGHRPAPRGGGGRRRGGGRVAVVVRARPELRLRLADVGAADFFRHAARPAWADRRIRRPDVPGRQPAAAVDRARSPAPRLIVGGRALAPALAAFGGRKRPSTGRTSF